MDRNDNILDGLALLDPTDDDHWTAGGLPRVDVVASLSEQDGVTRQEILALAPDLTRDTAPDLDDLHDDDEELVDPDPDPEPQTEPEQDEELSERERQKAALTEEIEACRASVSEQMTARDEASANIRALEATCAVLETRYAALFPPVAPVVAVQRYQKQSREQREQRAAAARRAPGAAKSQLDRAMMVRRGFGQNRPEPFLLDGD